MSDTLVISTRKGLFTVARKARGNGTSRSSISSATMSASRSPTLATDAPMPRSTTDILASSCTARPRTAGRRSRPPPIRLSPRATRRTTVGPAAQLEHGAHLGARSGRRRRARRDLVRDAAGRPVPLDRPWPELADGARALGPSQAQAMDGRRRRSAGHPFDLRRSAHSRRVWVAVSTGGIWFTEDAGESWALRGEGMRAEYAPPEQTHDPIAQDVHCLAQCRAAPERMWVQHHNGIFASSDESRTFTEITGVEPSTFGFAVAVHPREPDTAWFVPEIKDEKRIPRDGKLVVTRTRDGGKSFEVLSKGLPQSHAYDVVYRHALALDETGERLAFGSTTGGLWVSEDQGDSWACVTHTLAAGLCGAVRVIKRLTFL